MKTAFALLLIMHSLLNAQVPIIEMKPTGITRLNLSAEEAAKFELNAKRAAEIGAKLNDGMQYSELSDDDRAVIQSLDEKENYWDVLGNGCSWYCGAGAISVTASTQLPAQVSNSYQPENAHDLSFKTAWVEGDPGDGIGQFLTYTFTPDHPRITHINVVNGYVKSQKAYLENSRVKKLKVYLNGQPMAILQLDDIRSTQSFKFEPIGNADRKNKESLKVQPDWTLKFEILEVYKGSKYADVAITEIYFDGIDVH